MIRAMRIRNANYAKTTPQASPAQRHVPLQLRTGKPGALLESTCSGPLPTILDRPEPFRTLEFFRFCHSSFPAPAGQILSAGQTSPLTLISTPIYTYLHLSTVKTGAPSAFKHEQARGYERPRPLNCIVETGRMVYPVKVMK